MNKTKPAEKLSVADLKAFPVWEFALDEEGVEGQDETWVRPVEELPVDNLDCRLIGVQVRFANGTQAWALLGNVLTEDPRQTGHVLSISIEKNGQWFHLARYFDVTYTREGPEALAKFLSLPVDDVFPISYDLRQYTKGNPAVVAGSIPKEPRERISQADLISMIVASTKSA